MMGFKKKHIQSDKQINITFRFLPHIPYLVNCIGKYLILIKYIYVFILSIFFIYFYYKYT